MSSFNTLASNKYRKGVEEHGGNLWDMSELQLLDEAISENIDQFAYLNTLRDGMILLVSQIPLYNKEGRLQGHAKIDPEDYQYLSQWRWNLHTNKDGSKYARHGININGLFTVISISREVLQRKIGRKLLPGELADHKDQNTLNNSRGNLRVASKSQNGSNSKVRKRNEDSPKFRGVTIHKRNGKFKAAITHNKRGYHLGYYSTPEEAARAYDKAAFDLQGDFATLNFPIEN